MKPAHQRRPAATSTQLLRLALLLAGAAAQAKESDREGLPEARPTPDAVAPDGAATRCGATALQPSTDGLLIRAGSAACLRQMAPRLQHIIVAATAAPHTAAAAAAPQRMGSRGGIGLSRSTTTLRNLAVLRAQWQPPPATTLTTIATP
jgi:hypothetical protein